MCTVYDVRFFELLLVAVLFAASVVMFIRRGWYRTPYSLPFAMWIVHAFIYRAVVIALCSGLFDLSPYGVYDWGIVVWGQAVITLLAYMIFTKRITIEMR